MPAYFDSKSSQLIERTNRIGVDFLFTELKTGLTFLQVAHTSDSSASKKRCLDKAFSAYDGPAPPASSGAGPRSATEDPKKA
jgi:hypothetical protein